MTTEIQKSVARQRAALFNMLVEPLSYLAKRCAAAWPERSRLEAILLDGLPGVPYCSFLYAMDARARQISATACDSGLLPEDLGRDRAERPYMQEPMPSSGLLLSQAYISLRAKRPSLTAVRRVTHNGQLFGYLGADFDLRNLPLTRPLYPEPSHWQQLRGDPAIRGGLFQQRRVESLLDQHIDLVIPVLAELITESGAFHTKIHFSSSRATLWLVDDPYRYRILGYDALIDPDICLAYPHRSYPADAVIPAGEVARVLEGFRRLRYADEIIYLRAGSLNIFNGMISLNFSCDGSHYLPYAEFLEEDSPFWQSLA